MSQPVKITAIVALQSGRRAELLPLFQDLVQKSRAEAGNLRYDLLEDAANENRFVFIETWHDQAAVARHNASAHFQAFVQAVEGKTDSLDILILKDTSDNSH